MLPATHAIWQRQHHHQKRLQTKLLAPSHALAHLAHPVPFVTRLATTAMAPTPGVPRGGVAAKTHSNLL